MCAYYEDEQKIKKGDSATLNNQKITILTATHIRENKTMDITYKINSDDSTNEKTINVPYKTTGYGFELSSRKMS